MDDSHRSKNGLRVLHALRCIGVAGAERVATASGVPRSAANALLHELSGAGMVESAPGPFGGWSLTDVGRATERELLHEELEREDARDLVLRCYEVFLGLNPTLLEVCSDWQICRIGTGYVLNDHADRDYDARVLSRLIRIDEAVQEVCAKLTRCLVRFDVFGPRLKSALEEAMSGNHSHVADSMDSYHTIWFQLHEDLLTTLGISRDDERRDTGESG